MTEASFIKAPYDIDKWHMLWCNLDGTNDGGTSDDGKLQGETISSSAWTLDTGITEEDSNTDAATISGVSYSADTISTIKISGGDPGTDYQMTNRITTSGGRTLDNTVTIHVRGSEAGDAIGYWIVGTATVGGPYMIS
jgi:hypothetical protein